MSTHREQKLEKILAIFKARNLELVEENNKLRLQSEDLMQRLAMAENGSAFKYGDGKPQQTGLVDEIKVEVFEPDLSSVNVKTGISQSAIDFIKDLETMPVLPAITAPLTLPIPTEEKDTKDSKDTSEPKACMYTQ
jgi:hypothetical protein